MTKALYTEAEIKAAFWAEFHCSGELWFPERPPDNATRGTTTHWESFLVHLRTSAPSVSKTYSCEVCGEVAYYLHAQSSRDWWLCELHSRNPPSMITP